MNIIKRYKQPTPPYWRRIGDYALVIMVLLEAMLPTLPISKDAHLWGAFAVALIGATVKFWTNTKTSKR